MDFRSSLPLSHSSPSRVRAHTHLSDWVIRFNHTENSSTLPRIPTIDMSVNFFFLTASRLRGFRYIHQSFRILLSSLCNLNISDLSTTKFYQRFRVFLYFTNPNVSSPLLPLAGTQFLIYHIIHSKVSANTASIIYKQSDTPRFPQSAIEICMCLRIQLSQCSNVPLIQPLSPSVMVALEPSPHNHLRLSLVISVPTYWETMGRFPSCRALRCGCSLRHPPPL